MGHPLPTGAPRCDCAKPGALCPAHDAVSRVTADAVITAARQLNEDQAAQLHQKDLEINRLRNRLAAHEPAEDRPASAVTPTGSTREDWLETRLRGGAGGKTREAARAILSWCLDEDTRVVVVEALHELLDEQARWKDAWASTSVDMDHKVREASRAALDCDHHGQEIADLDRQATLFEGASVKSEAGRLALVSGLHTLGQVIDRLELNRTLGNPIPDDATLIPAMRKALTRLHEAHKRAWAS